MPRIAHSVAKRKRHKKVLKAAKGFWGDRSTQFQQARRALMHAMVYAYRDRKNRKREFRALWIARINAACRKEGLTYSKFMSGLKKAKIDIDRKMLSNLAINDVKAFEKLVELVKGKKS